VPCHDPKDTETLVRYVVDYELKEKKEKAMPVPKKHREKMAIVGSGPAGLMAAYELVKMGYPVLVEL